MRKKRAYFIGIAGKAMGQLAKAFKDQGWNVSGSDHAGVYPPISTYLRENNISYVEGYHAKNVPENSDLIVAGRSALMVDPQNPEYLKAKTLDRPVLSYPEVLQKYLIKKNSIVVAGTFGKTTITALVSWILINAGYNPSYMIGGVPLNMADGVKITDSLWSVVEGDEPPAMQETDPPKFLFYRPEYLLLTATIYDHPEVFKNKEDYFSAFQKLVGLLPEEGMLFFNSSGVSSEVIKNYPGKKISYSLTDQKADYRIKKLSARNGITGLAVERGEKKLILETSLLGKFNLENIGAAVALCQELGVDIKVIARAVKSFSGIKTRMEALGKFGGRILYWDYAQHPQKVRGTLEALKEAFPHSRIFCIFDPAATSLKHKESLSWYPETFDLATQVIVGKVNFLKDLKGDERVTGNDIIEAIGKTQRNVFYEPSDEKIPKYIIQNSKPGDIVVFMSSGGLRFINLIEDVKQRLSKNN